MIFHLQGDMPHKDDRFLAWRWADWNFIRFLTVSDLQLSIFAAMHRR